MIEKKKKVFWLDVETTGLDANKHGIIQIAYAIEVDGKLECTKNIACRPFKSDIIEPEALAVTGKTADQILKYMAPEDAFSEITSDLDSAVDKYDTNDKMWIGGYNVEFDNQFIRKFFVKNGNKFFGSYFNNKLLCVFNYLRACEFEGIVPELESANLMKACTEVCKEKPKDSHDAFDDIWNTINLYNRLKEIREKFGKDEARECA